MKKILVVGSINVDLVYQVENLPKVGQTIMAKSFETFFGGKGANQAYAIGQMKCDVELIGVIGNDDYGKKYLNYLNLSGKVNINNIAVATSQETGIAIIVVDQNGDNQIIVSSNANYSYDQTQLAKIFQIIDQKDIIVLQLEIPFNIVEAIINYAYSKKKIIILNPAPAISISYELLSKVDYLIPNETELATLCNQELTTQTEIILAAKKLISESKIKNLLITLGELGSILINSQEEIFVPAFKVKAIDTTCAGDSYLGAFVAAIAQNQTNQQAMEFATLVSSIVVTRMGAQNSIPTIEQVKELK